MESKKLSGWYEKLSEMLPDRTHCRAPLTLAYADPLKGEMEIGIMPDDSVSPGEYRRIISRYIPGMPFRLVFFKPERHGNKQELNRPLSGGIIIDPGSGFSGTLGLVVKKSGVPGFISAGHVLESNNTKIYQPKKNNKNDWQVGVVTSVSNYKGKNTLSDSGFAKLQAANEDTNIEAALGKIWKQKNNESFYTVTSSTSADNLSVGQEVWMQGSASSKTTVNKGKIVSTDATVSFMGGGSQKEQIITNYKTVVGDSGAPAFLNKGESKVSIIGLNIGGAPIECITFDDEEEDDEESSEENVKMKDKEERLPPNSRTKEYGVVSPWANIETDLGGLTYS